jgi:hypothetical protein
VPCRKVDQLALAAAMREWSRDAQKGTVGLAGEHDETDAGRPEVELWRVAKDTRELSCVVRYMHSGLDRAPREVPGCR